ncbi:cobalt-factor II C(20)-methyltransferase [Crassaminicella thermophila]|uniref:Cobalt-factor II C(20)-methyltransferase n=1 Tax=Crassaminicella thermophila TaxID=2599308 RepID=A0A5C0SHC7_CRATE|nr:cobalt-factor II C(20)-methyltransferase [Crassaminicella thermophila]QEK12824.1 cobalt-factor II C(20)-methyltransferase [Crassaminicella thermophila]
MSKFYGIGTGPGDSSLVTIKAVNTIKNLDILFTPEPKEGGESLALSIVKEYIEPKTKIKQRHFPMNFNDQERNEAWKKIAQEIENDVKNGNNVGFITLGDPMLYSTYVYILELLKEKIEIETISGISAFSNIAASQNFPLVMDKEALVVIPCTADEEKIDFTLKNYNSIVLMKVYKNFKEIIQKLKAYDLIKYAILVSNSSQNNEVVYRDLENITKDKISYFSTILINKKQPTALR